MTDAEFTQLIERSDIVSKILHDSNTFKNPFGAWITRKALFTGTIDRDIEYELDHDIRDYEDNVDLMVDAARKFTFEGTPDYRGDTDIFVPTANFFLKLMKRIAETASEHQQYCFAYMNEQTPIWGWMRSAPTLMRLEECDRKTRTDIVFNAKRFCFETKIVGNVIQYQLMDVINNTPVGKRFWVYNNQDEVLAKYDAKYIRKRLTDFVYKRDRLEDVCIENVDTDDISIPLVVDELNAVLSKAKQDGDITMCCQCHGHFVQTTAARNSYLNRGLVVPKRCYPCRVANRKNKEIKEEETA